MINDLLGGCRSPPLGERPRKHPPRPDDRPHLNTGRGRHRCADLPPLRSFTGAALFHRCAGVPPLRSAERCRQSARGPHLVAPQQHQPPPVPPLRLRPPLCSAAPAAAAARAASGLPLGPGGCSRQPGGLLLLGCSPSHRARSAPSRRRSCVRRPSRAPLRPCPPVPPCAALSGGPCASRPQTQRDKTGETFCASRCAVTQKPRFVSLPPLLGSAR